MNPTTEPANQAPENPRTKIAKRILDELSENTEKKFSSEADITKIFLETYRDYQIKIEELSYNEQNIAISDAAHLFLQLDNPKTELEAKTDKTSREIKAEKVVKETAMYINNSYLRNQANWRNRFRLESDVLQQTSTFRPQNEIVNSWFYIEGMNAIDKIYDSAYNNLHQELISIIKNYFVKTLQEKNESKISTAAHQAFITYCFDQRHDAQYKPLWKIIETNYKNFKKDTSIVITEDNSTKIIETIFGEKELKFIIIRDVYQHILANFPDKYKEPKRLIINALNRLDRLKQLQYETIINETKINIKLFDSNHEISAKKYFTNFSIFLKIFEESYQHEFSLIKEQIKWQLYLKVTEMDIINKDEEYLKQVKYNFDFIRKHLDGFISQLHVDTEIDIHTLLSDKAAELIKNTTKDKSVLQRIFTLDNKKKTDNNKHDDNKKEKTSLLKRTFSFRPKKKSQKEANKNPQAEVSAQIDEIKKLHNDLKTNKMAEAMFNHFNSFYNRYHKMINDENLEHISDELLASFLTKKLMDELDINNIPSFSEIESELQLKVVKEKAEEKLTEFCETEFFNDKKNTLSLYAKDKGLTYLINLISEENKIEPIGEKELEEQKYHESSDLFKLISRFFTSNISANITQESLLETAQTNTPNHQKILFLIKTYNSSIPVIDLNDENWLDNLYKDLEDMPTSYNVTTQAEITELIIEELPNPPLTLPSSDLDEAKANETSLLADIRKTKEQILKLFFLKDDSRLSEIVNFTSDLIDLNFYINYELKKHNNLNPKKEGSEKNKPYFSPAKKYHYYTSYLLKLLNNDSKIKPLFSYLEIKFYDLYVNKEKLDFEEQKYQKEKELAAKEKAAKKIAKENGFNYYKTKELIKNNQEIQDMMEILKESFPEEDKEKRIEMFNDLIYGMSIIDYQFTLLKFIKFKEQFQPNLNHPDYYALGKELIMTSNIEKNKTYSVFGDIMNQILKVDDSEVSIDKLLKVFKKIMWEEVTFCDAILPSDRSSNLNKTPNQGKPPEPSYCFGQIKNGELENPTPEPEPETVLSNLPQLSQ